MVLSKSMLVPLLVDPVFLVKGFISAHYLQQSFISVIFNSSQQHIIPYCFHFLHPFACLLSSISFLFKQVYRCTNSKSYSWHRLSQNHTIFIFMQSVWFEDTIPIFPVDVKEGLLWQCRCPCEQCLPLHKEMISKDTTGNSCKRISSLWAVVVSFVCAGQRTDLAGPPPIGDFSFIFKKDRSNCRMYHRTLLGKSHCSTTTKKCSAFPAGLRIKKEIVAFRDQKCVCTNFFQSNHFYTAL